MNARSQMKTKAASDIRKDSRKRLWLYTPQKSRLRKALFQVHLWIGLALSLYVVAIGLSGSALVFRENIQRQIEPHIYTVARGDHQASLQKIAQNLEERNPGMKVVNISLPPNADESGYVMLASAKEKLDPARIQMHFFNPYTGEMLGEESRSEGPIGWIANLHYFLFAGGTGLLINGVMGFGFFVLCLTGIVLWWPGIKRWAKALTLRRGTSWKRLNWELHAVIGFWCSVVLAMISFTGMYFAYPIPVSLITILGTGGNPKQVIALLTPPVPPKSSDPHTISIDDVIHIARSALPVDTPPAFVIPPSTTGGVYTVTGYRENAVPYSQGTTLSIDGHSGALLKRVETSQYPLGMRLTQYFHALHFGSFGGDGIFGVVIKVVWVFLGIAAATLGVTGLLMYWNRYLSKKWIRWRQGSRANAITKETL